MDTLQPQHTNRQYEEDLRALRGNLLKMGGLVERQIAEAMESLVNRDTPNARETIARDAEVNRLDVEVTLVQRVVAVDNTGGELAVAAH